MLVEQAERRRGRERVSVGPPRAQRGEGIDDAGDRAEEADRLAVQLLRIAAAVVALVVK